MNRCRAFVAVAVVGWMTGGCWTCPDWTVKPGRTDLSAADAAAIEGLKDGSCETTLMPFVPVLASRRQWMDTTGEGDAVRRTLGKETGGLGDLLLLRRRESVYEPRGQLIEWRDQSSLLLGLSQTADSGDPAGKARHSWRLLGGLLGGESHDGHETTQILWISFGD